MKEEHLLHEHEWEFLQTLWEQNKNNGTGTWFGVTEYAYFTCHECRLVEKRVVFTEMTTPTNPSNKVEGE